MNVFDAIYLNNNNPDERSYIIAETMFDIEVERLNKEYTFECGLIALNNEDIYCENTEAKSKNTFGGFIKGIFNAIGNFLTNTLDAITSIFKKHENINEADLKSSKKTIKINTNIDELDRVMDEEIDKGNKLFNDASSSAGVSDNAIDGWINSALNRIKNITGVSLPMVAALGFGALTKKKFGSKKQRIKDAENAALSGENDPNKQQQKRKIANGFSRITRAVTGILHKTSSTVSNAIDEEYKEKRRQIDEEAKRAKQRRAGGYSNATDRFQSDSMSDEEYLKAANKLAKSEKEIDAKRRSEIEKLDAKKEQDKQADLILKQTLSMIKSKVKSRELTKNQGSSFETFVNAQYNLYTNDKLSFNDYRSKIRLENLLKH